MLFYIWSFFSLFRIPSPLFFTSSYVAYSLQPPSNARQLPYFFPNLHSLSFLLRRYPSYFIFLVASTSFTFLFPLYRALVINSEFLSLSPSRNLYRSRCVFFSFSFFLWSSYLLSLNPFQYGAHLCLNSSSALELCTYSFFNVLVYLSIFFLMCFNFSKWTIRQLIKKT